MQWKIKGKGIGRAQDILSERTRRSDIRMAIRDLEINDPGIQDSLDEPTWLMNTLDQLNKNLQLPKLLNELAARFEHNLAGDEDANELRKIVESGRPPRPPRPPPPPPPKLRRIVLLGESTAVSARAVADARIALCGELAKALKDKGIPTIDWGDNWNSRNAQPAQPDDAAALFVRVVNTDVVNDSTEQLISLPVKLGQKLRLQKSVDVSQIVVWNCDGGRGSGQNGNGSIQLAETDASARLTQERLFLAEHPVDEFIAVIRSRLKQDGWPPALRLEHPGDNKIITKKLIDVILLSTMAKYENPYPKVYYLEATSPSADALNAELRDVVGDDALRDGLILAVHDLNLGMTDDRNEALWAFQERLSQYDDLLKQIIADKGIPDTKVIKIAIIVDWENKLTRGQYEYSYKHEDWTIAGMKIESETAMMQSRDVDAIKKRIDTLLGA